MKTLIEQIQEDDPSFDPLTAALNKTEDVDKKLWDAATDRVYIDGYYGPINPDEWKEQDEREPYTVSGAILIMRKVLDNVEDYQELQYCGEPYFHNHDKEYGYECHGHYVTAIEANDIKAALVSPWYKEIYGVRFP